MGCTPLLRAASHGAKDTVQMLLDAGSDIDMQDEHGNAAIHESCWNGFSQTAELLVKYNCNVCLTNKAGFTALHLAAQNGHNECSRVLLYAGCNPDIKNNYGDTALHTAARYGHAGVARILISARCKLSEQNKNGDTALHIAAALKRRKIAKILVESGIDTELLNKQNERAVDVARRKEHPEIILIITSYSKPRPPSTQRFREEHAGVTFKEPIDLDDRLEVCQESESHPKHEPKVDKQEKERRFFFFKKKKKDKEKATITPAAGHKKTEVEHCHAGHGKPAVHGFFSQYVPRDGMQLYRDLAGNIKQGPIGYAPVCQCGPSLRRLENSITDTRESLHSHIDASHQILSQRIDNLDIHTQQQASATEAMIHDRFSNERNACKARISERLQEERLETHVMFDQANAGIKEELEYWLNDKLASYGHCLDHHHDDSALPPRNLFFDFPAMGRLVRSRSDETLSASDYSGKFRKKDFYASRQAAMQQIRGWDVPNAENVSNQDRSRRRERNNNVIPNSNRVVTHAQVHTRGSEKVRNSENKNDAFSPSTNSTTSPGTLTSSQNAGMLHSAGKNVGNTENVAMSKSGNLPWKQTTHEPPKRDLSKVISQPRVTFSDDLQKQHVQQSHQQHQHSSFSSPPSSGSPHTTVNSVYLGRQSLRNSSRVTSPGPQNNMGHHMAPTSQRSRWLKQNLLEGSLPNTGMKTGELGDSRIPMLTGQERNNLSRHFRLQNVNQKLTHSQDHNDRPRTLSADSLVNEDSHFSNSKDIARCHSVENTLDDNDSKNVDQYNSGYFTDSAIRPSSAGSNSRIIDNSRSVRSVHSTSPVSRTTYRYRLPETSTSPDIAQHAVSDFDSSHQYNKNISARQVSSHPQSPANISTFFNETFDLGKKAIACKPHDASREFIHSQTLHKSMYGLNDSRTDTSGPAFSTFDQHDIYPERSDSLSKSESNLTSSQAHSVHFTSPVKECLQHESLMPTNNNSSPAYATGNKEDSTCSSNQDSGYGGRNHEGGLRRGADTSGGTPSSSFSMERSSCNTPSNADSPYTAHGELSNTGARTIINDQSSSPTVYGSEHKFSPAVLISKNTQGLPYDSRMEPPHRESSYEKSGFNYKEPFIVNSNSTVPFGSESLGNGMTKPFDSHHHQGSSFYNRSSHLLPPAPSGMTNVQQNLIHQASNGNRFSFHADYSNTAPLPPGKQLQNDKTENSAEKVVDVNERPCFQQNSLNNHPFSLGIDHSSPQAYRDQTYKPALPHTGTSPLKQTQTPQNTVSPNPCRYNTFQDRVSNSQQQNVASVSQNAVQAHIQGWYQRKLMEAAQRLRQSQNYSQQNFDQHESRNDTDSSQRQDSTRRPNDFGSYYYGSEQSHGASSQNKSQSYGPAANFQSLSNTQYGSRPQSHHTQWPQQNSTHESPHGEYQPNDTRGRYEHDNTVPQHTDRNFRSTSVYDRSFTSSNNSPYPQPVDQTYHLKPQNNCKYPSSFQIKPHSTIHYDPVQGSDV